MERKTAVEPERGVYALDELVGPRVVEPWHIVRVRQGREDDIALCGHVCTSKSIPMSAPCNGPVCGRCLRLM